MNKKKGAPIAYMALFFIMFFIVFGLGDFGMMAQTGVDSFIFVFAGFFVFFVIISIVGSQSIKRMKNQARKNERDEDPFVSPVKTSLLCAYCGERIAQEDKFCKNCGEPNIFTNKK